MTLCRQLAAEAKKRSAGVAASRRMRRKACSEAHDTGGADKNTYKMQERCDTVGSTVKRRKLRN